MSQWIRSIHSAPQRRLEARVDFLLEAVVQQVN
jgi:hypothetical protein